MARTIRVVIVDDSALMRQMLRHVLAADAGIEVVGEAADPHEARQVIKTTNPDVITLDIEMPRMDGLAFLEKIMTLRPTPVVMVSSLTHAGTEATLKALDMGAVDYVGKPSGSAGVGFEVVQEELIAKIHMAAHARVRPLRAVTAPPSVLSLRRKVSPRSLIAIGASTGGVERIREVLQLMPGNAPPIVISQHMGPGYLPSFADRLNRLCQPTVELARDRARLVPGHVFIAPGEGHLTVQRDAAGYFCRIDTGPPVCGHRPSVDVMFLSVAKAVGASAVGAILSGMGRDGAEGLAAMRKAGAFTVGEQESSCVVYGMPRAAMEAGAVAVELPVGQIAAELLRAVDSAVDRPGPG